jgi:gliding motility-associated lipoprotein GldH
MKQFVFLLLTAGILSVAGCSQVDTLRVYEKNIQIPDDAWDYNFHPSFDVNITDTSSLYNIYVTIRHTDAYRFSNIWLLITTKYPGENPVTNRVELPLADPQGNWLGTGMDDIFFHRILIQQNAIFDKTGVYHFSFEQDMRQDPLLNMMSAGLRIEKGSPR